MVESLGPLFLPGPADFFMIPFPQILKGEMHDATLVSLTEIGDQRGEAIPVCSGDYYYEDRKDDRYPADKGDVTHVFVGPSHLKLETDREYVLIPKGADKVYFSTLIDLGGGGYYVIFDLDRTPNLNFSIYS
jgi:hypothetical protein